MKQAEIRNVAPTIIITDDETEYRQVRSSTPRNSPRGSAIDQRWRLQEQIGSGPRTNRIDTNGPGRDLYVNSRSHIQNNHNETFYREELCWEIPHQVQIRGFPMGQLPPVHRQRGEPGAIERGIHHPVRTINHL